MNTSEVRDKNLIQLAKWVINAGRLVTITTSSYNEKSELRVVVDSPNGYLSWWGSKEEWKNALRDALLWSNE